MRTQFSSSAMGAGALLAGTVLALSVSTATHAATAIYGTPTTTATVERWYAFQSWATDNDHRALTYSIANKPAWASFDTRYGHLYGVPGPYDVGTYSKIVITASDGVSSASLPAFSITVGALTSTSGTGGTTGPTTPTTGSATVNWTPPTQNTNGSTLTNLSGYTIKYGTSASQLTSTVKVANAGLTSYVIENLPAGTYYFGVEAYNSAGQTSSVSNVVSKTIK